jgi:acyl carrier protein
LTSDARLKEDLAADSLTLVEINMALEDRFGLSIPDERLEKVQTVCDVFELLAHLLQPPNRH